MNQRENQAPKKTGKKRRRFKGSRRSRAPKKPQLPAVICSICEKPIDIISTAVSGFQKEEIAHIECVIGHLEESQDLTDRQKVVYIGQGSFAVVEYKNAQKHGSFTVVKKIAHEDGEQKKQLKASIQDRLPEIRLL